MNEPQIIALYEQDQRKDVVYPDTRREATPNVVRHIDTLLSKPSDSYVPLELRGKDVNTGQRV
jgi:hypothetical protein